MKLQFFQMFWGESIKGIRQVKAYNREDFEIKKELKRTITSNKKLFY